MARRTNLVGRLPDSPGSGLPEELSATHGARKALFARALAQGYLAREELDAALPPGALTDSERWLLHYSLRAADIEVREGGHRPAPHRARTRADREPAASKAARRP